MPPCCFVCRYSCHCRTRFSCCCKLPLVSMLIILMKILKSPILTIIKSPACTNLSTCFNYYYYFFFGWGNVSLAQLQFGGPSWKVRLGRRDSTTASRAAANTSIPPPTSNLSALISSFSAQGLSLKNMVALAGGHTVGKARCTSFRGHIYNDSNIDTSFARSLQQRCPRRGNDNVLANLDRQTPTCFDNLYYKNLLNKKGLLHSDQELFNGNSADFLVKRYAASISVFFKDFARGMIKMGNIKPLTGSAGQIRINCRKIN
ncbi:hypothetical protein CISIN_1g020951mg [Citrus sinensis]|uniref:peroxidase n=1 Tax=Citrus sinensis TaxID=2711 RepID=A0A067EZT7_CITSI|nr:hypothetical protein CISIN_1g020951mg [Citrus sinensis]